jgi:ABC-type antimicrobial peptide transport system permease subunit
MEEMATNPTTVVLTRDLANEYQVEVGDTIRAFESQTDIDYFSFTVIAIVDALTHPMIPESTYIPESEGYSVGSRLIWMNSMYAAEKIDLAQETYSYLTVATKSESNDTRLALNLLSSGGEVAVYTNDWAAVDDEYDSYINGRLYKMDRAVDSMLSIASTLITVGVMLVYATESIRGRKRDNALLRAMGTDGKILAKIQAAELLFIVLFSILILLLYGPLFIANSLIASLSVYTSWSFLFPVPMFVIIPWTILLLILGIFLASIIGLIAIIAVVSVKTDLREALSNSWALGGPLVESDNS